MAMQYDVSSVRLNQSGFGYIGRVRVKGLTVTSAGGATGTVSIYDSATAPVTSSTYARTGTTVTVSSTAHGLSTGQRVGISFAVGTGGSATNGNYTITRTGADTFTLTDINTGSITAGAACNYVANTGLNNSTQWHATFDIANVVAVTNIVIPGEGLLIENSLYVTMTPTYVTGLTAFYG